METNEPRKKKPPTFYYTGWLIGILISWFVIMPQYNWIVFHPLYNPTNHSVFFIAQIAQAMGHVGGSKLITDLAGKDLLGV